VSSEDALNIKARTISILHHYTEQPTTLDPILAPLFLPLMPFLQAYSRFSCQTGRYEPPPHVLHLFDVLSYTCTLRGFKTCIRFFPNEASDLEPVVELLHFQADKQWAVQYTLLVWLAQIILVPFAIDTIDSRKTQEILVKRIVNLCRGHIEKPGKTRDAAAFLLARLLNRPDVLKEGEMDLFLQWLALEYRTICNDGTKISEIQGLACALVQVFKQGHRNDLISRIDTVFNTFFQTEITQKYVAKSTVLKKLKVQLAQRVGLIFLKPKIATWRYQRGFRSL